MGRKAKYATLRSYRNYIDIILEDLQLPSLEELRLEVIFNNQCVKRSGVAYYNTNTGAGYTKIYRKLGHIRTIELIMHELKHIQQYYQARLIGLGTNAEWEGKPAIIYPAHGADKDKYWNSPWEIEARAYEKQRFRLFADGVIPQSIHVGTIQSDGVIFYKIINPKYKW